MRRLILAFTIVILAIMGDLGIADEIDDYLIPISRDISFDDLSLMYPQSRVNQESLYIEIAEPNDGAYVVQSAMYSDQRTPFVSSTYIFESDYSRVEFYEDLLSSIPSFDEYPLVYSHDGESTRTLEHMNALSLSVILSNPDKSYYFEWFSNDGFLMRTGIYPSDFIDTDSYGLDFDCSYALTIEKIYTDSTMPYSIFCIGNGICIGSPYDEITRRLFQWIIDLSNNEIVIVKDLITEEAVISMSFDDNKIVEEMNCLFSNATLDSAELEESFAKTDSWFNYIVDPFSGSMCEMTDQSDWIQKPLLNTSERIGFMTGDYKYSHVFDFDSYIVIHEAYMKNEQSFHTLSVMSRNIYLNSLLDDLF